MQHTWPVLWLVASVLAPGLLQARQLGLPMTGNELLIEASKTGPGPAAPGIYAVTPEGDAKLAIAYGRSPRWAPDRTGFAYLSGAQLWFADIAARTTRPCSDGEHLGTPPTAFVETAPFPHALAWTPDGRFVLSWEWASTAGFHPYASDMRMPFFRRKNQGDGTPVPRLGGAEWIGRVSFSRDGSMAAYEVYEVTPGIGATASHVMLLERATNQPRHLKLVGTDAAAVLNPVLSPKGEYATVDCILPSQRHDRATIVVEVKSDRQAVLPRMHPTANCDTTVLGWSPDGESLLVLARWATGVVTEVCVVASPSRGEQARVRRLPNMCPAKRWACFSPDGTRVAVFGGQFFDLLQDPLPQVEVVDLSNSAPGSVPLTLALPEGLRPVVIDW